MEKKKLPSDWEWKRLGDITICLDSKRIPLNSKEREKKRGDIPYYGANGIVDYINEYLFDEELLLLAEDGGSWGGDEKCAYIIKGKSWVNNHAHILKIKNVINIKFLEFYLNTSDLRSYISGTTRGKLNQKRMNEIMVPIPPKATQDKISSLIINLESLKSKRKEANKNSKKVLQSVFINMFGDPTKNGKKYPVKTLKEISEKITDGTHITPKYQKQGIPFLRVTDLTNSNDTKKYISEEEHEALSKRCKPEKGDILYTKNGTIGIAKTIDWDYEFSIFVSLCLIKPRKELVLSKYLEVFLNTPFALSQAVQHSKKGTITNLHLNEINKILVPVPPLKKQEEFLGIVKRVEKIMKHQVKSGEEINNLSGALMQRAFNK
jgi:restriction endonuclease S subunit